MQRETVRLREIRGPVNAPGSLEHVRVGGESGDNSAEKLDCPQASVEHPVESPFRLLPKRGVERVLLALVATPGVCHEQIEATLLFADPREERFDLVSPRVIDPDGHTNAAPGADFIACFVDIAGQSVGAQALQPSCAR
jgi:hypothetical protein